MSCRAIDVFPLIASSYGASGMCAAGPNGEFTEGQQRELLTALNQALPIGMKRLDAKGTLARWVVPVVGGVFTLPPDCLDVRQAFLNGCALDLRDQWYEGQIGHRINDCQNWCGSSDLIDMQDGFAIPEEWPSQHQDIRLGLMAEAEGDAGHPVQIKFKDRYGYAVEQTLELVRDQLIVQTDLAASDVLAIHKGVTYGGVVAYIMYPNGARLRLMRIPANVASPSYHKKKLPMSFGRCTGELSIIGKMRFIPLTSVTDTLPICDEAALSFLLQALHSLKNKELGAYNDALTLSVNELDRELRDIHPTGVVTQMAVRSGLGFHRKWFN